MIHVVLYEPEIPPNTGNVMRLCVNTGAQLHLIHPLGFELDDSRMKRAGLDYREYAQVREYDNLTEFIDSVKPPRIWAMSTRGARPFHNMQFADGDALMFGPETRGLPTAVLEAQPEVQRIRIPMQPESRSLNLSNAVAIVLYEAWRQLDFDGCR